MMKGYKKVMDFIAGLEKWILVLSTVLILILTVGNVLSRKLLHRSWSFTEELGGGSVCIDYSGGSSSWLAAKESW